MPNAGSANRSMFWRIIRRLLGANRGRLFVILLALGAGAAVTAALLNLQVDAKRRIATEFRAFGHNVVIAPRHGDSATSNSQTISTDVLRLVPRTHERSYISAEPFLYVMADISTQDTAPVTAVVVGTTAMGLINSAAPGWKYKGGVDWNNSNCVVGAAVASKLRLSGWPQLHLRVNETQVTCQVASTLATGGAEDNQVFANLRIVQDLASQPGRASVIQLLVPGPPSDVESYITNLQKQLPELDVRPVRQFTEAEAKIYNRISGLLSATVAVVLILTALCVMAAMTNVAMERKNDVGLMKAIGGATRRVLRLFLAEAALLGLAGGIFGATVGILLSIWLGKAVFGVAARPRLIVYPVSVALTILVAIAGAYPLRRLASIRPASVFRGEA
jgi:putative ABC transport system permease protein